MSETAETPEVPEVKMMQIVLPEDVTLAEVAA